MIQKITASSELEGQTDSPSNFEVERAIEYLLAHRREAAEELLVAAGAKKSGSKVDLQRRLLKALADDAISAEELVSHLDAIEGWGNQQIILMDSTELLASRWQDKGHVEQQLKTASVLDLLNNARPIALPDQPVLSQILWNEENLRLTWTYAARWEMRVPSLDPDPEVVPLLPVNDEALESGELVYKAYRVLHRRLVCYFDWDLITCEAALALPRMPKESDYELLAESLLADAERFLEVSSFEQLSLRKLIRNLEKSDEVTRRDLVLQTKLRSQINMRSGDKHADVYSDPAVKDARNAVGNRVAGDRGQFYWLPDDKQLERRIHMRVYPTKQRVSIHDQCTEAEVRHVLSRVRHHCR